MDPYRTQPSVDRRRIYDALSNKWYFLVVENLYEPIGPSDFTYYAGLASPYAIPWTSPFDDDNDIMVLILSSLHLSAKHISKAVSRQEENEEHWHRASLHCFQYALLLLFPSTTTSDENDITSDELIRQWAAQGFLTSATCSYKPRAAVQEHAHSSKQEAQGQHADDIFHVGNIILQAFSEYSLLKLPFSPATEDSEATQTAAHFLIYHDLIASHLSDYEIFHQDNWLQNEGWIKMACKQGMENQGWHMNTQWESKEEPTGLTTLVLRHFLHTSSLVKLVDNIFPKLIPCLRVLDLSYTLIESLPTSVRYLSNLRLLSLRGCRALKSLSNASNSGYSHPQKDKDQMNSLLYLDLTLLNINILPIDFFQGMVKLEELMLGCSNLVELPCSMSTLSGLLTLEVTGSKLTSLPGSMFEGMKKLQSLKLIDNKLLVSVPRLILEARALKVIYILGCDELKEVGVFGGAEHKTVNLSGSRQLWDLPKSLMEEDIQLDRPTTLESFSLINAPRIRWLSLRGYTKLEHVELKELSTLEDLDLSGTAIKELPINIPNLPQLRRLLLMGFPAQSRFPWHKLQRFLSVFFLDHYAQGYGNHYDDQVVRVCVKDSRLFYSFNDKTKDLIAPSTVNIRRLEDEENMLDNKLLELAQKRSPYGDVHCRCMAKEFSAVSMAAPPIRQTARHVQISAAEWDPRGLGYLLAVTKSISMTGYSHVYGLSDLSDLEELEECKLYFCHQMNCVFEYNFTGLKLQNARISQLKNLNLFCNNPTNFSSLKHLHLEYCPRLESIMPRESALPNLTTLDILFCYNLNTILYKHPDETVVSDKLPNLRRMRLQELPLLKNIWDDDDDIVISAPALKELHVRGCWSLRRLPRLRQENPREAVEVHGERAWWQKLFWDSDSSPAHSGCYKPKLPPPFASFNERATVKSYLSRIASKLINPCIHDSVCYFYHHIIC
uniref:Disease resistance protein At4g27190-like leucine-rich repeats domain-containing protein n=1 Tax=Leersia perrieri TaxID=77586 RepID=A0A0D9XS23_9ORYZ